MNVDTAEWAALTEAAGQADAARRETAAAIQAIRELCDLWYERGRADALGLARRMRPARKTRDHLTVIR